MAGTTWPAAPAFVNEAERTVWTALRRNLREHDVLIYGLRLTDAVDGEVEIDLMLLLPDVGVAVVEVKGGHVSYANGEVRQTGADGTHPIDPAGQAAKQVRALRRFLERQPNWSRGPLKAAWLVALPYTQAGDGLGPQLPNRVLIDQDGLADSAGRVFDRLLDPDLHQRIPAAGWVDAAVEHLLGTPDEPREIRMRTAERLRLADERTARHATLLAAIRQVRRFEVVGSAGTGKTWMAMEQARRWASEGERVGVLTYTRGVAESMRRALAPLPQHEQPAYLGTYHQLGYEWGIRAPEHRDADFWDRRGPAEMAAHAACLADAERFTAVVVDEAQDFRDEWWTAVLASATADARIAVFRDDEQSVFAERRGRPEVALVPLVLDENLRNAQQVIDTFRPLIEADPVCRSGRGFPVEFVECGPGDVISAADDAIADLTDRRGWLPEHVALLTTCHRHPVQHELDIDKSAYWAGLWDDDEVFYSTVSGFKGLERPAVVLAVDGFHDGVDPRNVLYAGMSRARDLLVVVAPTAVIEAAAGPKVLRRLQRG